MSIDDYTIEGKKYCLNKEYEKAIQNYTIAIEMINLQSKTKPQKYYRILQTIGKCNHKLQKYNLALEYYTECYNYLEKKFGKEATELESIQNCIDKLKDDTKK